MWLDFNLFEIAEIVLIPLPISNYHQDNYKKHSADILPNLALCKYVEAVCGTNTAGFIASTSHLLSSTKP